MSTMNGENQPLVTDQPVEILSFFLSFFLFAQSENSIARE
jgi:hypothetical protein